MTGEPVKPTDDYETAFPHGYHAFPGMSVRTWLAGQVLRGAVMSGFGAEQLAARAVEIADATLRKLNLADEGVD